MRPATDVTGFPSRRDHATTVMELVCVCGVYIMLYHVISCYIMLYPINPGILDDTS